MAVYDIAAGATVSGVNGLIAQIYAVPTAREHLFKGTQTQTTPLGDATVTYDLKKVPVARFSGPTDEEWKHAHGPNPTKPLPAQPVEHAITMTMSDLNVGLEMAALNKTAIGTVQVFAVVSALGGKVTLDLVAVGVNVADFSNLERIIVEQMVIPEVMDMAKKLLTGIALPQLPSLGKLKFAPLTLDVSPQGLIIATSRETAPPTDLSGFAWPDDTLFALTTFDALNVGIKELIEPSYKREDKSGSDAFTAAGKVTATNVGLTFTSAGRDVRIAIDGTFNAYGELCGTGVGVTKAVLCPIGAAADAIADPDNWDKVISEFELIYTPKPLPILASAAAAAPAGTPSVQTILFDVNEDAIPVDLKLLVTPEWSGSVTGTVLAGAATVFVDMISLLFPALVIEIVKAVLKAEGHASLSLKTSDMTEHVKLTDDVALNVTLLAAPGPALTPFQNTQVKQALVATIT